MKPETLKGFATTDFRRTLVAADLPGGARRVYCVSIEPGRYAGGHWHRHKQEWLYLISGGVRITLIDAGGQDNEVKVLYLFKLGEGVLIPPSVWHQVEALTRQAAIMVIADQDYDPEDDLQDIASPP